jgi:hypothetical protein
MPKITKINPPDGEWAHTVYGQDWHKRFFCSQCGEDNGCDKKAMCGACGI